MADDKFKQISQETYDDLFKDRPGSSLALQEKTLRYAIKMRNFEIELYWKRAAYFWAFTLAALGGFVTIQKVCQGCDPYWSVAIGCFGFIFAVAWYLVNSGSKYWQENWENHVDLLEDGVINPLFKVVIDRKKENRSTKELVTGPHRFSVSKINQIVSLFIAILWIVLIFKVFPYEIILDKSDLIYILTFAITFTAFLTLWNWGRIDDQNYKDLRATIRKTRIYPEKSKEE